MRSVRGLVAFVLLVVCQSGEAAPSSALLPKDASVAYSGTFAATSELELQYHLEMKKRQHQRALIFEKTRDNRLRAASDGEKAAEADAAGEREEVGATPAPVSAGDTAGNGAAPVKLDSASGNSNSGSNSGPSGNDAPVVTPTVAEGGTPAPPGGETSSKLSAQPATKPEPSTDGGEGKTAKPVKKPDTTAKPVAEAVVIDPEVLKQLESQKKLKEKLILVLETTKNNNKKEELQAELKALQNKVGPLPTAIQPAVVAAVKPVPKDEAKPLASPTEGDALKKAMQELWETLENQEMLKSNFVSGGFFSVPNKQPWALMKTRPTLENFCGDPAILAAFASPKDFLAKWTKFGQAAAKSIGSTSATAPPSIASNPTDASKYKTPCTSKKTTECNILVDKHLDSWFAQILALSLQDMLMFTSVFGEKGAEDADTRKSLQELCNSLGLSGGQAGDASSKRKAQALSKMLSTLNPDIVTLQEAPDELGLDRYPGIRENYFIKAVPSGTKYDEVVLVKRSLLGNSDTGASVIKAVLTAPVPYVLIQSPAIGSLAVYSVHAMTVPAGQSASAQSKLKAIEAAASALPKDTIVLVGLNSNTVSNEKSPALTTKDLQTELTEGGSLAKFQSSFKKEQPKFTCHKKRTYATHLFQLAAELPDDKAPEEVRDFVLALETSVAASPPITAMLELATNMKNNNEGDFLGDDVSENAVKASSKASAHQERVSRTSSSTDFKDSNRIEAASWSLNYIEKGAVQTVTGKDAPSDALILPSEQHPSDHVALNTVWKMRQKGPQTTFLTRPLNILQWSSSGIGPNPLEWKLGGPETGDKGKAEVFAATLQSAAEAALKKWESKKVSEVLTKDQFEQLAAALRLAVGVQ